MSINLDLSINGHIMNMAYVTARLNPYCYLGLFSNFYCYNDPISQQGSLKIHLIKSNVYTCLGIVSSHRPVEVCG